MTFWPQNEIFYNLKSLRTRQENCSERGIHHEEILDLAEQTLGKLQVQGRLSENKIKPQQGLFAPSA